MASGSAQTLGWALIGQAEDSLQREQTDAAIALLERARNLGQAVQRVEQIWLRGLLARASLLVGDNDRARAEADSAFALLQGSIPTAFYVLEGYSGVAEVYLALARTARTRSRADDAMELESRAKRAVQFVKHFARVFPIARGRADEWRGVWADLRGEPIRAQAIWMDAASLAKRSGRPNDEARLRLRLASPPQN